MALTLAEAEKLSNDALKRGVIETIIKDSPILQRLPFIEIVGNGLSYNQEATLPQAHFYAVGDPWSEGTPTFTHKTATLAILGVDADVDKYLAATRSNLQDLEATVVELGAKSVRHAFEERFIYGRSSVNNEFDGLRSLIPSTQTFAAGDSGAPLTLDMLDELIDKVKGGKPDMLLMSRRSRRTVNKLVREGGGYLETQRDALGNFIQFWNGIALGVTDFILDTHTVSGGTEIGITGGTCSSIYALSFGEDAVAGLTAPGGLTVEGVGTLETKDATRFRIKWYCAMALFSAVKAAQLLGVTPSA